MRIRRHIKTQRGTTITEVVVAVAMLVVVGGSLLGCFTYGFFAMQMARENQRATQIVLEKVETIRLYNWDQVTSNGFIPTIFSDVYDPQAPQGSQGVVYKGSVTIANFPDTVSYANKMRQFTVSLSWTNRQNIVRSRSLTTWVAKDGLQNYVY